MARIVIFTGPPGSGKSTQATYISREHGLTYFDTGTMFRRLKTEGLSTSEMDKGVLMDPRMALELIKKEISELMRENPRGISISGSLRTVEEAFGDNGNNGVVNWLDETYGKNNLVFFRVNIPKEESIKRNTIRGEGRKDDAPELMATRLNEYETRTKPVFDKLKKDGYNLIEIDGLASREEVFADIRKHLSALD